MYQFIIKTNITFLVIFFGFSCPGQNINQLNKTDSLSLKEAIRIVLSNYPSIKQAETAIEIADAKIGTAKSTYYPDIDISGSYTRIGPVPKIDFPGMGEFQLAPENNYNAAINFRQTIWDFGRTSKEINYENQNKEIAIQTVEQLKQKLSFSVVRVYYNLVFLQEAISIKEEQINNLTAHKEFIQKKMNTGSATEYDLLSTQVKLSNTEGQKTDLEVAKEVQTTILNSLLGNKPSSIILVEKDLQIEIPGLIVDSMLNNAFLNREEIKIADQKVSLADLRYQVIKSSTNPMINLFASAGFKNGYVPNLNDLKANFVIGLGLKIPLFDANRKKFNLKQALAFKQSNQLDIELAKRNVTNDVIENNAQLLASQKKIKQSNIQLELATKALAIAEVNYKAGVITNLELLDATTNLSESKLGLLKSQIEYLVNIYQLKLATGERIE